MSPFENPFQSQINSDYNKPPAKSPEEVLSAMEKEISPVIENKLKYIEKVGKLGELDRGLDRHGIALTYFKGIEEKLQPKVEKLLDEWLASPDNETKKRIINELAGSLEPEADSE